MTKNDLAEKLFPVLMDVTPQNNPKFIIGEEENLVKISSSLHAIAKRPILSAGLVVGDIGRGKTHFFKYLRSRYDEDYLFFYLPEMIQTGAFETALNHIQKDLFSSTNGNCSLLDFKKNITALLRAKPAELKNNAIFQILEKARLVKETDLDLVLSFFSAKLLTPVEISYLKKTYGIKLADFFSSTVIQKTIFELIEIMCFSEAKRFFIILDELDRLFSSGASKSIQKVGVRLLDFYRSLFNEMTKTKTGGVILIGATQDILEQIKSNQAFFSRFSLRTFNLNPPSTLENCLRFLKEKSRDVDVHLDPEEIEYLRQCISENNLYSVNSWRDFCIELNKTLENQSHAEVSPGVSSEDLILSILQTLDKPATSHEIINAIEISKSRFKKGLPSKIMKKLIDNNQVEKLLIDKIILYKAKKKI